MTTKMFGEPVLRVEDPKLVTGTAHYLDDLGQDALGVAFVRSPHAHARVVEIDASGALEVDGLVAVYTYDDLLAADEAEGTTVAEPLPLLIPHPALTSPRTGYPLARDEVNHVGEAVVMVVAADRYLAEDAAERVLVTYDVLPPVVGVDNARRADRTVHDDVPDNVAAHLLQEVGDVDAAMAAAPHTLSLSTWTSSAARRCRWRARACTPAGTLPTGRCACTPRPRPRPSVRAAVAARLALPLGKVECVAPMVGGGFGVKIVHPWPEEVLVPWAAKRLGHEVKWVEDRREHFVSSAHERGQLQEVDGRLRRRRPDPRAGRAVLARQRRLHAVRRHRAHHHRAPSCSARTSPAPTAASGGRSTPTP